MRYRPVMKRILFCLAALTFASHALAESPVVYLVRHAERAAISGRVPSDTGLSREGKTRAESLATALKDAKIAAIYTTEYKRTRETAAPVAQSSGIRSEVVSAGDLRPLIAKIKAARGNVLVVGHSNTLPQIINALGVHERVAITESDYDNLFLVLREPKPRLIRLHFR